MDEEAWLAETVGVGCEKSVSDRYLDAVSIIPSDPITPVTTSVN